MSSLWLRKLAILATSHSGNSSKINPPIVADRQWHKASHSTIKWWGVSSICQSSQKRQDTSPGGGLTPWNTIAFCLLKNAWPVRKRTMRPKTSLLCLRRCSALLFEGPWMKYLDCLHSGLFSHCLVHFWRDRFSTTELILLLLGAGIFSGIGISSKPLFAFLSAIPS